MQMSPRKVKRGRVQTLGLLCFPTHGPLHPRRLLLVWQPPQGGSGPKDEDAAENEEEGKLSQASDYSREAGRAGSYLQSPWALHSSFCCAAAAAAAAAAEACLPSQREATQECGSLSPVLLWDGETALKRKERSPRKQSISPLAEACQHDSLHEE